MTVEMTPEVAAILRSEFPDESVGKLPRVFCRKCRDSRLKVCEDHTKSRCDTCHNYITSQHLHLDYVGHAEVTDRLLEADPLWTWEPLALDATGLPAFDRMNGLWIQLTVAGVTRLGYGDAGGKDGPDAVKEVIGDAIRNGAMRFGVALGMWGAKTKARDDGQTDQKADDALGPADMRDVALAAGGDRAKLGPLHRQAKKLGWLGRTVTNENGDEESLGALIQRLGEPRREP